MNNPSLIKDGPRKHPATAHVPIVGEERSCGECIFFCPASRKVTGRCMKWAMMRPPLFVRFTPAYREEHPTDWWRELPTIPRVTRICKYFEPIAVEAAPGEEDVPTG